MELIEKLDAKGFEKIAKLAIGEKIEYVYTIRNYLNAQRFCQDLNRMGRVTGTDVKYSVSRMTRELGYLTIYRIK